MNTLYRLLLVVAALASSCCATPCPAQEAKPITIAQEHRVPNRTDHGVCWFCCAEMAGKHQGIKPLYGLTELVAKTHIGLKTGATEEAVGHWMNQLKLRPRMNTFGKSQKGYDWLMLQLKEGLPVIVSINSAREGNHALVITNVTAQKMLFDNGQGYKSTDWVVSYIDPNTATKDWTHTWSWFLSVWTGRAFSFHPAEQDPVAVQPQDLRPGRLLLQTGEFHKVVQPDIQQRVQQLAQPLQPPMPGPQPGLPPFTAVNAVQTTPIHISSNQDIKDGINRPLDVLEYGCYSFHDYFTQYRKR